MREVTPLPILGFDTDNDTVFINETAHSDASGRLFRQHPVSHSGVSGHLRIVAA